MLNSYASIEPLQPEWLWAGRIPLGEVTYIRGSGGIGKGFLMADLVSRVTRGADMPDGSPCGVPAGVCLMATMEDDPNTVVTYRLRAAQADMSNVRDITTDNEGIEFALPDNLSALREAIYQTPNVRMVTIDPLAACATFAIGNNIAFRRKFHNPLRKLAQDTGVAIVVTAHVTKSGKMQGSEGIRDAARSVLAVSRDSVDPRERTIHVDKSNNAQDTSVPDLLYTITGEGLNGRVKYNNATARDAESLAWTPNDDVSDLDALDSFAGEWSTEVGQTRILEILKASHEPLGTQELARQSGTPYQSCRVIMRKLARHDMVTEVNGMYASR